MLSRKEYVAVLSVLCVVVAGVWAGVSYASPPPQYTVDLIGPISKKGHIRYTYRLYIINNDPTRPLKLAGALSYHVTFQSMPGRFERFSLNVYSPAVDSNIPFYNYKGANDQRGKPWVMTVGPASLKRYYFRLLRVPRVGVGQFCVRVNFYAWRNSSHVGTCVNFPHTI